MTNLSGKNKFLFLVWLVAVTTIYLFYSGSSTANTDDGSSPLAVVPKSWKPSYIDGIAMIAASSMAADKMVDYSIASIRKYGNWKGPIYVLTDRPECFSNTASEYDVTVVTIPTAASIIEIKANKPKLMSLVPLGADTVLYLDVDIMVTKDLSEFLFDAENLIQAKGSNFDFAMFLDAAGHYVGFCSGCEKWHTGVIVLRRQSGGDCMAAWQKILLSGQYGTDQESIDEAERQKKCPNAVALPSKHLLFAKDYLAVALTSSRTFLHMTGAGRLDEQDFFYRLFAVPHFRESLSKLDHTKFVGEKNCPAA